MEFMNDMSWVMPLRSEALTVFFTAVTNLGYGAFLFIFISVGYYFWRSATFYQAALLLFLTGAVNILLKDVFQDPRPDLIYRLDGKTGDSFGWPKRSCTNGDCVVGLAGFAGGTTLAEGFFMDCRGVDLHQPHLSRCA